MNRLLTQQEIIQETNKFLSEIGVDLVNGDLDELNRLIAAWEARRVDPLEAQQ